MGLDRVPEFDKPRRHRRKDLVASKRRPVATTRDHWPHLTGEGYGFGRRCSTSAGPGHLADYRWVTAGRGAELSERVSPGRPIRSHPDAGPHVPAYPLQMTSGSAGPSQHPLRMTTGSAGLTSVRFRPPVLRTGLPCIR